MFKTDLIEKINSSLANNFGEDNYWEERYGPYILDKGSLKRKLKNVIKPFLIPVQNLINKNNYKKRLNKLLASYEVRFEKLYKILDADSKKTFIEVLAYRILGYKKVKLSLNTPQLWEEVKKVNQLFNYEDFIVPKYYTNRKLSRINLNKIGYDIDFYYLTNGVMIDFISEQYAFKKNGQELISARKGDVVLELGACWGATGLYFAEKVGPTGKVYSFEFIPENIEFFKKNMDLNPGKKEQIELVTNPVHSVSDCTVYFKDAGASSVIKMEPFEGYEGQKKTISVDDFIERNGISKVDFISMDIEGSEPYALNGAIKTIKKFKPKLAISIYHSLDDFANIPNWIADLDLGYTIHIGHYTIYDEETVCFASLV